MGYIWMLVFGLIAGGLAKFIMPGKDPGGCIVTALIGIGGSFIGGMIGNAIGFSSAGEYGLGWGLVWSVIGALIILYVWKKFIAPKM